MTKDKIHEGKAKNVSIVANTFLATIGGMGGFSKEDIVDGLVTILYSLLAVSFKGDTKAFSEFVDGIGNTLKDKFREADADK